MAHPSCVPWHDCTIGRRNARNAKATLIVIAHGLLEFGQVAQGILPHLGILGCLRERLDHMVVRLKVGRATLML